MGKRRKILLLFCLLPTSSSSSAHMSKKSKVLLLAQHQVRWEEKEGEWPAKSLSRAKKQKPPLPLLTRLRKRRGVKVGEMSRAKNSSLSPYNISTFTQEE